MCLKIVETTSGKGCLPRKYELRAKHVRTEQAMGIAQEVEVQNAAKKLRQLHLWVPLLGLTRERTVMYSDM